MGKRERHKLPVEINCKLWARHYFRSHGKYVNYGSWCEEQVQRINEVEEALRSDGKTKCSRMAYVEYTQAGTEGIKCQVMDANPPPT